MNDTPAGRQIHTAKSNWIYIMVGECKELDRRKTLLKSCRQPRYSSRGISSSLESPFRLLAPTSQVQAAMWSSQFWPTVYRRSNPLGPHPSMVSRGTEDIKDDASVWMALAHRVALDAKRAGIGEAIGAR